MKVSYRCVT